MTSLAQVSKQLRKRVLRLSHEARVPHLGSSLSCVDILVAAYWRALDIDPTRPEDPGRDRLIFSKGHASLALYCVLHARGFFGEDLLFDCNRDGAALAEQPSPGCAPGVELATGSLGHGLPVGVGLAMGSRITGVDFRVVVVMSDGECNEGSVWEAAMFAGARSLDNLLVVVDANGWQATARTTEVLALEPQVDKWRSFGWDAEEIDGHDPEALSAAMSRPGQRRPRALIARTVKGKGVPFMEDDNNWHYRIPDERELEAALLALEA